MKSIDLTMVKIGKNTHANAKLYAVKNGIKLYEVVDTATSEYLTKQRKKETETAEKE